MRQTATLERPMVEDTLFGDGLLQMVDDGDPGPEGNCFCICACKEQATKVSGSQYNGAVLAVGK